MSTLNPPENESDKQVREFQEMIREGYKASPAKRRARQDMEYWNRIRDR